jgi:pimeloyl-ACP methyl ester carboxylesterase
MGLFRGFRRGVTLATLGLAGGALAVTARHMLDTPQPLESALPAEARIDRKHGGDVYYNVAGSQDAQPLVLLHDFYPGASNYEFRQVFGSLAERYRVYAPDWLGFGMSEHPHVAYTGEFYAGALTGFLRDVVARPALVVAHGHAANIAVRAASDTPALFERLVLVAPAVLADIQGDPTFAQTLMRTTQRFMLGLVPYAVLSTRPALRWSATSRSARAQQGGGADDRELDHLYASAHQFGGHHALLALLTGELDLPMRNAFALLEPPVLVVAGEQDQRHPRADVEDLTAVNPHAELRVIQGAGDAVFEDRPDAFLALLAQWLAAPATRHALDEAAMLPTDEDMVAEEMASASRSQVGIEHASGADADLPTTPTEGDMLPRGAEAARGDESLTVDALVGEPSAVVPGVSDMGLEGLNTPDLGGIAALDEEGVTLGPDEIAAAAEAPSGSPEALLPEAGVAGPQTPEEREARAGEHPPLAPATNIGQEGEPAGGTENADIAGEGDVAGLAHMVQTPESDVATPTGDVQTTDEVVRTARQTVDTPEMLDENTGTGGGQDVTAEARPQVQRTTRAAPRQPGARTAPSDTSPPASGKRGTASSAKPSGTKGGSRSTGGTRTGRKRSTK